LESVEGDAAMEVEAEEGDAAMEVDADEEEEERMCDDKYRSATFQQSVNPPIYRCRD
jgi:hypothetical protein